MDQVVAVGRRKRAIARVYLKPGSGDFKINKREFGEYFPFNLLQMKVLEPFTVADLSKGEYDIHVHVHGGGITGQAEAVRLGITRALVETNAEFKPVLKKAGLVTRDARKVERKKYGKKKARKSTQFSKR